MGGYCVSRVVRDESRWEAGMGGKRARRKRAEASLCVSPGTPSRHTSSQTPASRGVAANNPPPATNRAFFYLQQNPKHKKLNRYAFLCCNIRRYARCISSGSKLSNAAAASRNGTGTPCSTCPSPCPTSPCRSLHRRRRTLHDGRRLVDKRIRRPAPRQSIFRVPPVSILT